MAWYEIGGKALLEMRMTMFTDLHITAPIITDIKIKISLWVSTDT